MDTTTATRSALLVGAAAALAAAGCASTGGGDEASPSSDEVTAAAALPDTAVGRVRQVGSTPFTRTLLQTSDGQQVRLVGPLTDELRRLVGARVRAMGEREEAEPEGEGLRVLSYEILSVDGERPEVGLLRYGGDGRYYLERQGGEDLELKGLSRRLQGHLGAKLWVVTGAAGTVERYGILRPAGCDGPSGDR